MKNNNKINIESVQKLDALNSNHQNIDILKIIPDIVYRINSEGMFTFLSDSVVDIGYTIDELIGKHFSIIIHPKDIKLISRDIVLPKFEGKITGDKNAPRLFDERRSGSRSTKNLEFRVLTKKNRDNHYKYIFCEVMATGQYGENADGKIEFLGTVGIIRNIDERIKLSREKMLVESQLHQAQKMEAIGQLAGGVAHDFNNILGAISGYADIISRKFGDDNPKLKKYAQTILSAATRAANVTGKLLTFARKSGVDNVSVDMHEIILDVVQLFCFSKKEKINLSKSLDAKEYCVMGEPNQLQNAILNILLNAKDAISDGGDIKISSENISLDESFMKKYNYRVYPGDFLLIMIKDTGIGMDVATKERIFEPFFTTKDIGKGTGLGLASVFGIVESVRGIIVVESEVDKGTKIKLYFPIDKPILREKEERKLYFKNNISNHKILTKKNMGLVLVIDDEDIILESTCDLLEGFGYSVKTFKNAIDAIEFYKQNYTEIVLVMIDMVMPEMNGEQCFYKMKKINTSIIAILSTGYTKKIIVEKLFGHGLAGFIQKPFVGEELANVISETLEKYK